MRKKYWSSLNMMMEILCETFVMSTLSYHKKEEFTLQSYSRIANSAKIKLI